MSVIELSSNMQYFEYALNVFPPLECVPVAILDACVNLPFNLALEVFNHQVNVILTKETLGGQHILIVFTGQSLKECTYQRLSQRLVDD